MLPPVTAQASLPLGSDRATVRLGASIGAVSLAAPRVTGGAVRRGGVTQRTAAGSDSVIVPPRNRDRRRIPAADGVALAGPFLRLLLLFRSGLAFHLKRFLNRFIRFLSCAARSVLPRSPRLGSGSSAFTAARCPGDF